MDDKTAAGAGDQVEVKLFEAAYLGDVSLAKDILVKHPSVNVNWKNPDRVTLHGGDGNGGDFTPLHIACGNNHDSVVAILLGHPSIEVGAKEADGETAFFTSCFFGRFSCVRLLLRDARVDINDARKDGFTPLSMVASYGRLEVVAWLIASGRELNLGKPGTHSDAIAEARNIDQREKEDRKKQKLGVATLLGNFKANQAQTRLEIRQRLGISQFLVSSPPHLTMEEYAMFLGNRLAAEAIKLLLDGTTTRDQHHAFFEGKPVTTLGSPLAQALGIPCSFFASSVPETFTSLKEITSLALDNSNLTALPESLGNPPFHLPHTHLHSHPHSRHPRTHIHAHPLPHV